MTPWYASSTFQLPLILGFFLIFVIGLLLGLSP
jgi:uncharacterized integral membrane protein